LMDRLQCGCRFDFNRFLVKLFHDLSSQLWLCVVLWLFFVEPPSQHNPRA
jgi:hypothetical protein